MDANHMDVGPVVRGSFSPADIRRGMLLYAVTDRSWLRGVRSWIASARRSRAEPPSCSSARRASRQTRLCGGATALPLCRAAGVPLVIDDDVEAARRSGADGVHVGQV